MIGDMIEFITYYNDAFNDLFGPLWIRYYFIIYVIVVFAIFAFYSRVEADPKKENAHNEAVCVFAAICAVSFLWPIGLVIVCGLIMFYTPWFICYLLIPKHKKN